MFCFLYTHHQESRLRVTVYVFISWLSFFGSGELGSEISLPDYPEPQQLQPGQKTIGSDTQSALLMMGVKTPRKMLRNN